MKERVDYTKKYPKAVKGLIDLEKYLHQSDFDYKILGLIKVRASQINDCAFCLDMHTKEALKAGETEQRLYGLYVWRESPYYSEKERIAIEWTEVVTEISKPDEFPEELYQKARNEFSEKELLTLNMAVIAINSWNRLAKSLRTVPGSYQVK